MILSDTEIQRELKKGNLKIKPITKFSVQPSSINLRLGKEFKIFRNTKKPFLDTREPVEDFMELIKIKADEPLIIHPREFVLGTTIERVKIPNHLVARLEGKSSLGRIGIIVHATAGYIDPGFEGCVTLEISNLSNIPIGLYYQMKICQMSLHTILGKVKKPYGHKTLGSKYQFQKGPTASRLYKEFKFKKK